MGKKTVCCMRGFVTEGVGEATGTLRQPGMLQCRDFMPQPEFTVSP